jgi:hypothetical protein
MFDKKKPAHSEDEYAPQQPNTALFLAAQEVRTNNRYDRRNLPVGIALTEQISEIKKMNAEGFLRATDKEVNPAELISVKIILRRVYSEFKVAKEADEKFDPLDDASLVRLNTYNDLSDAGKQLIEDYISYLWQESRGKHALTPEAMRQRSVASNFIINRVEHEETSQD